MTISYFLDTIDSTDTKCKIETKSGISLKQIVQIEERLNIKLPDDLVSFYSLTNGLEGDDWIFNIIPLNEVERLQDEAGEYLVFAEYMIYSETCGREIDKADSNNYKFFHSIKGRRKYLANSIVEFIKLYCNKGTFGIFNDD